MVFWGARRQRVRGCIPPVRRHTPYMGIAKKPRPRVTIDFPPCRRLGLSCRKATTAPADRKTLAAGNRKWHHDTVTGSEVMYSAANLNHLTHTFVPEDIPFVHGGNTPIVEMHIRATNSTQCDLDGVPWVEDLRFWYRFNTDITFAIPADCFHCVPPAPAQRDTLCETFG